MKITLEIPVYATATFTADIDTEGKTDEEIYDEFLGNCDSEASLCWQCSNHLWSDMEMILNETSENDIMAELKSKIGK